MVCGGGGDLETLHVGWSVLMPYLFFSFQYGEREREGVDWNADFLQRCVVGTAVSGIFVWRERAGHADGGVTV